MIESQSESAELDDLVARWRARVGAEIDTMCDGFRAQRQGWGENPGPLRVDDCFLDGPVDRARSWTRGGVRYTGMVCAVCGIASVADSRTGDPSGT